MFNDLTGQKFGKLMVIKRVENAKDKQAQWLCQCECGNTKIVKAISLRKGNTRSCGCLAKPHGLRYTRLYGTWKSIKQRCCNPNSKQYKGYGGRGIKLCQEWVNFKSFYDWAMDNGYDENAPKGKCTLDRIDNNGNYEPSNCRFVTEKVQANNRRDNHFLTFNNETHTVKQWAEIMGITYETLFSRLNRNWSIERALTTPVKSK